MTSYDEHQAWNRVRRKKGFYRHMSAFLGTGIGFFFMNLITDPGNWWFMYPMASWSLGLAIHYFSVFGIPIIGSLDEDWEQKEFEKEIEKNERLYPAQERTEYLDLDRIPQERRAWRDSDLV